MTPVEIHEYKMKWMKKESNPVNIHSDYRRKAIDYCKTQLHKKQWVIKEYTDVYQDTFYFEHHQDARSFKNYFKII